jgi:hypothetical protein
MQMTGGTGILSVPSEHLPGLVALVVITPALWVALYGCRALAGAGVPWSAALVRRFDGLSFTAKAALFGCLVGGVVHAAIVPTHWADARATALLFVADVAGFAVASWWTFTGRRHWRLFAAAMLGGTACFYALYIVKGWEGADPVGLLTTSIELAGALIVLSPVAVPAPAGLRPGGERLVGAAALPVALLTLLGTAVIADAAQAAPVSASSGTRTSAPAGASGSIKASPAEVPPAMAGMAPGGPSSGSSPATTTALSLPTTSPGGPIVWPDDMAAMAPGMSMVTPDCVAQPTVAQQEAAVTLVDQTVAAAAPYQSLAAAKAAGYVPVTSSGGKTVHYINPSIYRQGRVLDPHAIPALVYVNTPHGAVLSAAMYLAPRTEAGAAPPQPGGCLTQWHIHSDLCFSGGTVVGNDNSGACSAGSVNKTTAPMMHVWLTPVPGGPLTPDPPASSEIEAADQLPARIPANGTA